MPPVPERLALVTGASGGIGAEVGRRLRGRGLTVVAVASSAASAARAVQLVGPGTVPVVCDLSDPAATQALCARVASQWRGSLEVLVCNAGTITPAPAAAADAAAIDRQLAVGLSSAVHLVSAALPGFVARDRGHVLATVSMGGVLPLPGSAVYSAAKSGLRAYLSAVSAELRATGVSVSGIYPSAVDTAMLLEEVTHGGSALNFVGRVHTVDEVAAAFERALDARRLEVYVPYADSIPSRLLQAFPHLLPWVVPVAERLGRRGMRRYLQARQG